jgi:hypothetical protein
MIRAKCERVYRTGKQPAFATLGISPRAGVEIGDPRCFPAAIVQKLIRAAHAKEKQLLEELVQPPESP